MKPGQVLYMFAIMPPPDVTNDVQRERLAFAEQYGFVKGLKPPVHITLFPPFNISEDRSAEFEQNIQALNGWAQDQHPFNIVLNGFGFFAHSRHPVIFINVADNPRLQSLYSSFTARFAQLESIKVNDHPYHPHITIGYRDIPHRSLALLRDAYRSKLFNASFSCHSIFLWRHDGTRWQTLREFSFATA